MAFGRRKPKEQPVDEPESVGTHRKPEAPVERPVAEDLDGPFDIEDFDDAAAATEARLDLGAVLLPLPPAAQLQVELTETGVPSAGWVVTANGRFTIAAYAAPTTAGLWREVAGERAGAVGKEGGEVVGTAGGVVGFIGVDGYRWMIRCVVNASAETVDALTEEARNALMDTVIRRGDTPLPVRTPLPVQLPEPMATQLREAAAAQGAAGEQPGEPPEPDVVDQQGAPAPAERRSASGSAMQQLRATSGWLGPRQAPPDRRHRARPGPRRSDPGCPCVAPRAARRRPS